MTSTPRFSVVIPTRNRQALLPTALRSVLSQTEADFEVIVADDGSTDETAAVTQACTDPRVRYLRLGGGGVSAARNAGAAAARGELLVFLDDDDELLPDALERFSRTVDENGWDIVHAGWVHVAPDRGEWITRIPADAEHEFHRGSCLPGTLAIRTRIFRDIGGYDSEVRFGENTALGWKIRAAVAEGGYRSGVIEAPTAVRYRGSLRSYDEAKLESARYMLETRRDLVENPDVGPARSSVRRSNYLAIAAVSAARLGRRREALRFVAAAVRANPRAPARYRNVASVLWLCATRRPSRPDTTREPGATPAPPRRAVEPGRIHGIVITYNRPARLRDVCTALRSEGLASLTVVDNAPSAESKEAALSIEALLPTTYLAMPENLGPAGGIAAGMTHVLEAADANDWVVLLDDDRLTGTPGAIRRLRDFGEWLVARGAPVGAVGLVGARFDRRRGRLVRPSDRELVGPLTVDYVAGGQLPTIRVAAVREVGTFDPELFFAFDDLDFCLRLHRHDYRVYTDGRETMLARKAFGRTGEVVSSPRRVNAWRRYYAVRNHIVVMRRYGSWPRAVGVTLAQLGGRPVSDLVRRRSGWWALTVAGVRGCADAWTDRLGRRAEPEDGS